MNLGAFLAGRIDKQVNRRLGRAAFEARRLHKFRNLARFVQHRSRHYARIMQEHGIDPRTCQPEDFPVLTKADVVTNFDDIVTDPSVTRQHVHDFLAQSRDPSDRFLGRYVVVHSSGTTGEKGYFLYSDREWSRGLSSFGTLRDFQLLSGRRQRVAFIGATGGHLAGISIMATLRDPMLRPIFRFASYDINAPFERTVAALNQFQPDVVVAYGLAIGTMAEHQLAGRLSIRPRVVTNSGEAITPMDRAQAEAAFGRIVRNFYVSSEHLVMAVQEPGQNVMYLAEDDLIIEPGEDHALVTNLFNRTIPLIRYRMGDFIQLAPADGSGPYRAIREVSGRSERPPIFRNRAGGRDWISPHVIYTFVHPHLRRHRLVQRSEIEFDFEVLLDPALKPAQFDAVLAEIRTRLDGILAEKDMTNVVFQVCPVAELNPDPTTGKFLLITTAATPKG
jgi:phenylacetate-coenzyme A ligase PaaK-like adenylate-forming protein